MRLENISRSRFTSRVWVSVPNIRWTILQHFIIAIFRYCASIIDTNTTDAAVYLERWTNANKYSYFNQASRLYCDIFRTISDWIFSLVYWHHQYRHIDPPSANESALDAVVYWAIGPDMKSKHWAVAHNQRRNRDVVHHNGCMCWTGICGTVWASFFLYFLPHCFLISALFFFTFALLGLNVQQSHPWLPTCHPAWRKHNWQDGWALAPPFQPVDKTFSTWEEAENYTELKNA